MFSIFILATKGACELCKEMAKVGADGVLVMPPFYFKKRMTVSLVHKSKHNFMTLIIIKFE